MKKIIGIGNAIVDLVCKVDDEFLQENLLIKGSMSLIDKEMALKLSELKSEKITSGGSVANTMAALAQLGCKTSYIGKVSLDDFGRKFISEIEKSGCEFLLKNYSRNTTARSFVLLTLDAQRTMCTFLGCASEIYDDDIKEDFFKGAAILYLEGYLWDRPEVIVALKQAIKFAKNNKVKIAFTLSDLFCVARHKADFLELIANDLDILFANENEITELLDIPDLQHENFQKLLDFFAINKKLITVVTRSEKGCILFSHDKQIKLEAEDIKSLIDTTGAGDCFAAGFLYGITHGFTLEKCAQTGNLLASKIIQKIGARFEDHELEKLL